MNDLKYKQCKDCRNRSDVVWNNFAYCYIHDMSIWMLSIACRHYCDRETGESQEYF